MTALRHRTVASVRDSGRSRRTRFAALAVACLLAATAVVALPAITARAAASGTIESGQVTGTAAGTVDYTVYLPAGYDDATEQSYPTVYLLHGRGDTQAAWQRVSGDLDQLIGSGELQPLIVVMPDAPWNDRGSWYTDSQYTGSATSGPGVAVETAFAHDLVAHIDATYRTVAHREARAVGGYSMGGAGALRLALAHQDTFSAGIVLSPAVYTPQPPADSSTRDYGAYGVGDALFDAERYTELSYPAALERLDPALPVHLFIAVGDDEWPNPDPAEAHNDIDFESAQLYNTARRAAGVTAELRILDGGHDWDVWQPAFREAIVDVGLRLRTEAASPWEAELIGSSGDDRAGGVVGLADGGSVLAVNLEGAWDGYAGSSGLDVLVLRRAADGSETWRHAIATTANDRAYGVVEGTGGHVLVAGYTRGTLATGAAGDGDDGFVAAIDAAGERAWTVQLGDPGAADRLYAIAPDGAGGAYVAGYTSGLVAGTTNAGDKDALIVRVSADGEVLWSAQLGGPGEDKAMAAALAADGGVYVAGSNGGTLPGIPHLGANDAWIAKYGAAGELEWLRSAATDGNDQFSGLVTLPEGAVLAVGHTRGSLGGASLGDNDIVVRAYDTSGVELWTSQLGTSTDDRGVTAVVAPGGGAIILGTTYGAMGEAHGGVDVVAVPLAADGTVGDAVQIGTRERDGADEWDEANLFAARSVAGTWITGLTFGAPVGQVNAGAGDVFVTVLADEAAPEPTTPGPTDPEPSSELGGSDTTSPVVPPRSPESSSPAGATAPTTDPTRGASTPTGTGSGTGDTDGTAADEAATHESGTLARSGTTAGVAALMALVLVLVGATALARSRAAALRSATRHPRRNVAFWWPGATRTPHSWA